MNKPVFCTNCVHFQPTTYKFYKSAVWAGDYACWAKAVEVKKHNARAEWTEHKGIVSVDKRNKHNTCPLYKKIWWKFWVC